MVNWKELNQEMNELLQLDSRIIAVKRMEKKDGYKLVKISVVPEGSNYVFLSY